MTAAKAPRQQKPPHSEWKHGPVAAAINSSIVLLCLAAVGKLTGIPAWMAALAGGGMTAAVILAGLKREPRLSNRSLTYRGSAFTIAGAWLFGQLAEFGPYPTNPLYGAVAGALVAALGVWVFAARRRGGFGPAGNAVTVVLAIVTLGWSAVHAVAGASWLWAAATSSSPMPADFASGFQWLWLSLLSIAVLAGPLAVLGKVFAHHEQSLLDQQWAVERAMLANTPAARMRRIQRLICTKTNEVTKHRNPITNEEQSVYHISIAEIKTWANDGGEDFLLDLRGAKNATPDTIRALRDDLAVKMDLPRGCGVEILEPIDGQWSSVGGEIGRGYCVLSVSRKNMLKGNKVYADHVEIKRRSILDMVPLGLVRAGRIIGIFIRESSVFLWGQKGSGKSVTLQDIVAGLVQCEDCIVWGIDLNGGAAFAPFNIAWVEGRADRPAIDWIATDLVEVRYMAEVAKEIAVDRKVFYRDAKRRHDANLMPVGDGRTACEKGCKGGHPPQITIVIDEGAEVLGIGASDPQDEDAKRARKAMDEIMRLARDAAVNIVFSGLRATSDVAGTDFKAGTRVRIGMRVSDTAELGHGFGDYRLNTADIPDRGMGFIRTGEADEATGDSGEDVHVFKSFFLSPSTMERIGELVALWRPFLDERAIEVAGKTYLNRWRRTLFDVYPQADPELLERLCGGERIAAVPAPRHDVVTVFSGGGSVSTAPLPGQPGGPDPAAAMFQAAAAGDAALREGRDLFADDSPPWTPADPPKPPTGGGGGVPDPQPEPAEDEPVEDERTDEEIAADAQAEYDRRFKDMVKGLAEGNLPPEQWATAAPETPDMEAQRLEAQDSRAVVERCVRYAGPEGIGWKELWRRVKTGGDWGGPVDISEQGLRKLMKEPGSPEPAAWLAERQPAKPYVHRNPIV